MFRLGCKVSCSTGVHSGARPRPGLLRSCAAASAATLVVGTLVAVGATPALAAPAPPSFSGPTSYATGGFRPSAVAVANLGNGNADVVATNRSSSNVSVLLGNGSGGLSTAVTYDLAGADTPTGVTVADLGNGQPDVLVASASTPSPVDGSPLGSVTVLAGNGDGTLGAATNYYLGDAISPVSVAVANLTTGHPSAVTANEGSSSVSVLPGNADASLGAATNYSTGPGTTPDGVAVAPLVSGNATPDIVTSNSEGTVSVLLGNGDGTFATATAISVPGQNPLSVATADLNGDGRADIVTGNGNGTVSVLLGNGDGTLAPAVSYTSDPTVSLNQVVIGNLNGDGKPDIATANDDGTVSVLPGNGDGTFATASQYPVTTRSAQGLALGDLNNDARPDIATANTSNDVSVLLNTTPGTPAIATTASGPVPAGGSVSDTATVSGGFSPAGTVTFTLYGPGDGSCATAIATSTATLSGPTATSGTLPTGQGGTYNWVATYNGNGSNAPVASACGSEPVTVSSACTTTITTPVAGNLVVTSGKTCVFNTSIGANVTVSSGASVALIGVSVGNSLSVASAGDVTVCGSTVHGAVSISGSSNMVLVGDGGATNCAGNTLSTVSISSNTGGLAVSANVIGGSAAIQNNRAPSAATSTRSNSIIIAGNSVAGSLACSGNTPTPTDSGVANTVSGARSGQCAGSF